MANDYADLRGALASDDVAAARCATRDLAMRERPAPLRDTRRATSPRLAAWAVAGEGRDGPDRGDGLVAARCDPGDAVEAVEDALGRRALRVEDPVDGPVTRAGRGRLDPCACPSLLGGQGPDRIGMASGIGDDLAEAWAKVRSTIQRRRPCVSLVSTPRRAMRGLMERARRSGTRPRAAPARFGGGPDLRPRRQDQGMIAANQGREPDVAPRQVHRAIRAARR